MWVAAVTVSSCVSAVDTPASSQSGALFPYRVGSLWLRPITGTWSATDGLAQARHVGHTDHTGELGHNLALSQKRAESVAKALTTRYGIAAQRVAAKGVASYAPVASNQDETGRARNRRVELVAQ